MIGRNGHLAIVIIIRQMISILLNFVVKSFTARRRSNMGIDLWMAYQHHLIGRRLRCLSGILVSLECIFVLRLFRITFLLSLLFYYILTPWSRWGTGVYFSFVVELFLLLNNRRFWRGTFLVGILFRLLLLIMLFLL